MIPLNYLAIIVTTIVSMVIGTLWYSPILFAKPWMQAIGKTEKDLKSGNMGMLYGAVFVIQLIFAYMIAYSVAILHLTTVADAVSFAIFAWFGFLLICVRVNSFL